MILVMRKQIILFAAFLTLCGVAHTALSAETQPDPASLLQLKERMRTLREDFDKLETGLSKKPPAYEDLIVTLDEMKRHAQEVQSMRPEGHPGKKFKRLFSDIEEFKRNAKTKSSSGVEDSMNRLAENCFRCHLSHSE